VLPQAEETKDGCHGTRADPARTLRLSLAPWTPWRKGVKVSSFIIPAVLAAAGPLAMADFSFSPVAVTLKPGESFAFQVYPHDLNPRSWVISEGGGRNRGTLGAGGKPGQYKYVAPTRKESHTLEIQITDPASGDSRAVTVRIVLDEKRLQACRPMFQPSPPGSWPAWSEHRILPTPASGMARAPRPGSAG
jgi:hypothetical protein